MTIHVNKKIEVIVTSTSPDNKGTDVKSYKGFVGLGNIPRRNYDTDEFVNTLVFGLCNYWYSDELSHMSYYIDDYFKPYEILERTKEHGYFYFDAGTTMPEIKISYSELKRAFEELGLVEND